MKKLSIIIITGKKNWEIISLDSIKSCPYEHEVIINRDFGFGFARNQGARMAKYDLLVYFDDDVSFGSEVWKYVEMIERGKFVMSLMNLTGYWFANTRGFMILKDDFWKIGGFDENFAYGCEDRDFFLRAVDAGMKHIELPISLLKHKPHVLRTDNKVRKLKIILDNTKIIMRHSYRHRDYLRHEVIGRLMKGQFRTCSLYLIFSLYLLLKGWK